MDKYDTFRTSLPGIKRIPDPLNIYTLNQWYILDSVSENLVRFNHIGGTYEPVLAESWTSDEKGFRFKIRDNLKFHDGSPLTIEDVLASFQRIVRVKSSTHFQIWQYLNVCQPTVCEPIRIEGNEFVIDLTVHDPASFFMFLSSPEGAIWAKSDLNNPAFEPKRFSGFYFPSNLDGSMLLTKNTFSVRNNLFPLAPQVVEVFDMPRSESIKAVQEKRLDAVMLDYTPFSNVLAESKDLQISQTLPIAFVYFLKLRSEAGTPFNSNFLKSVHQVPDSSGLLTPAFSLLPPGVEGQLASDETERALDRLFRPREIIVGYLPTYHSADFVNELKSSCELSGISATFSAVTREQFYYHLTSPNQSQVDYMLLGYMASDKFPLTQLKLLLGEVPVPFPLERPDLSGENLIKHLRAIQTHVIENQWIVPLYFAPVLRIARNNVDLGDQPTTDGELQFWRVNESLRTGYSRTSGSISS